MNAESWLMQNHTVRFGDSDAAGVMHFHRLFCWCHEAWEASLENFGLTTATIFPGCRNHPEPPEVALPIIHCQANFRRPIKTGDQLIIELNPSQIDLCSFQIEFQFICNSENTAHALIRHLAINSETRQRCELPEGIGRWLEASNVGRIGSI